MKVFKRLARWFTLFGALLAIAMALVAAFITAPGAFVLAVIFIGFIMLAIWAWEDVE